MFVLRVDIYCVLYCTEAGVPASAPLQLLETGRAAFSSVPRPARSGSATPLQGKPKAPGSCLCAWSPGYLDLDDHFVFTSSFLCGKPGSSYVAFDSIGGTVGAVVTCPLEVVKTRLQSSVATFHAPPKDGRISNCQQRGLHYSTSTCPPAQLKPQNVLPRHRKTASLYYCIR